jgi:uncharacterized protein YjeT (DUF2065 family)
VLWLAFTHPVVALMVVAILVGLTIWLLPKIWRFIRALIAKVTGARISPHNDTARRGADV